MSKLERDLEIVHTDDFQEQNLGIRLIFTRKGEDKAGSKAKRTFTSQSSVGSGGGRSYGEEAKEIRLNNHKTKQGTEGGAQKGMMKPKITLFLKRLKKESISKRKGGQQS